jgi:hypothetical protein
MITVGSTPNSGMMFDPGTNPVPGDTARNDCSAALQAALDAAVTAPHGNANRPARVVLGAGVYSFWNPGTTPSPILMKSPNQVISGAGGESTYMVLKSSPQAALVPPSGAPQTNQTGMAVYIQVSGGSVSAILLNGTRLLKTDGSGSNATSGAFCVQSGGTWSVTYSVAPTVTQTLSFLMSNVAPNRQGVESLCIAAASNQTYWAHAIDFAGDPTNGGAYPETQKPVHLTNIRTGPTGAFTDYDVTGDGCEVATVTDVVVGGGLSWCVPRGLVVLMNVTTGSDLNATAQTLIMNGVSITGAIVIPAFGTMNQSRGPQTDQTVLLNGIYVNPVSGPPRPVITVSDVAPGIVVNVTINNATFYAPAGPAAPGWITFGSSKLNLAITGRATFAKLANNPMPLVPTPPNSVNIYAGPNGVSALNAQSLSALLVNLPAGYGGATVLALARGTGANTPRACTLAPLPVAGALRVSVYIKVTAPGVRTVPTISAGHDEDGTPLAGNAITLCPNGGTMLQNALTAPGRYSGSFVQDIDASGSPFTVLVTPTGSVFDYDIIIEQVG